MEVEGTLHALRRLDLDFCGLTDPDGEALGRAMSAKVFPQLKQLWCGGFGGMGDEGWLAIMKGLEEGGCTELQILDMSHNRMSGTVATALTRALSSGLCHYLEELYLVESFQYGESIQFVLQSIKSLCFPSMRKFDFGHHGTNQGPRLLSQALKAGAFPKLESLWFAHQSIHHSVWEALEAGSCPELRELHFRSARFDTDSSTALASAIASGSISKLQDFRFGQFVDGDGTSLVEVLNAMASSCPDLRQLEVSGGFRNAATR